MIAFNAIYKPRKYNEVGDCNGYDDKGTETVLVIAITDAFTSYGEEDRAYGYPKVTLYTSSPNYAVRKTVHAVFIDSKGDLRTDCVDCFTECRWVE